MKELNGLDDGEDKPFKNEPFINNDQTSLKKKKIIIIIIVSVVVLAIVITLLCVFLIKSPKKDDQKGDYSDKGDKGEEEETEVEEKEAEREQEEKEREREKEKEREDEKEEEEEPPDDKYKMIKLEVYSDSDDKEILFLSDEFNISNINQDEFSYSLGSQIINVDGITYPFTKSMKLSKGTHFVELFLNETKNSCENMFKNCKDIKTIYFNNSYDCLDNMDNMFSGCSSLLSVNFHKIKTSLVKTMKNLFDSCDTLENIDFKKIRY